MSSGVISRGYWFREGISNLLKVTFSARIYKPDPRKISSHLTGIFETLDDLFSQRNACIWIAWQTSRSTPLFCFLNVFWILLMLYFDMLRKNVNV